MNCYHYLIHVILFRKDGQVYRHQGQIRLAAGQVLPAGYTGPLQLANEEVENFFSSIDPVPQTVIMSAASVQPPQGHSTFTGEYATKFNAETHSLLEIVEFCFKLLSQVLIGQ